jgi:hypothetical protein
VTPLVFPQSYSTIGAEQNGRLAVAVSRNVKSVFGGARMKRHIVLGTIGVLLLFPSFRGSHRVAPASFPGGHASSQAYAHSFETLNHSDAVETENAPYKLVNYYGPHPWLQFWKKWPETLEAMRRDMPVLRDLGVNTVRIFVHPASFGWPTDGPPGVPNDEQLKHLDQVLDVLDQHQLKARLCLFDLFVHFSMISESVLWMEGVMNSFEEDPRIAMWELRNEVDLSNAEVRRWVLEVFPEFKRLAGSTPTSISISAAKSKRDTWRATLQDLVRLTPFDFYDVHLFSWDDIVWTSPIEADILDAVRIVGPEKLLVHEVGQSTFGEYSEALQRDTLQTIFYFGAAAGVRHWGVWTFNDFVDGTRIDEGPGNVGLMNSDPAPEPELSFGLFRLDGSKKSAVEIVRSLFNGSPPSSAPDPVLYNSGFEDEDLRNHAIEGWRSWRSDLGWGSAQVMRDVARSRTGVFSIRLTTTQEAVAGFFNVPAWPVTPGRTVRAGGHVWMGDLPIGATVRLVASWHNREGAWLGIDTWGEAVAPNPDVPTGWAPLSLAAVAPPQAAHLQLFVHVNCPTSGRFVWFDDFFLSRE